MKANELARYMRERALLIDGDETLNEKSLQDFGQVQLAKAKKVQRVEDLKKLYFNAGRWVGGAKDYAARVAFEDMKAREKLADR
jgi:hypothetical protein